MAHDGIGFIMMPKMVKTYSDMPVLLYVHAGCALLSLRSILAYFPNAPPTPPRYVCVCVCVCVCACVCVICVCVCVCVCERESVCVCV